MELNVSNLKAPWRRSENVAYMNMMFKFAKFGGIMQNILMSGAFKS